MIDIETDTGTWPADTDWAAIAGAAVVAAVRHSTQRRLIEAAVRIEVSVRFAEDEEVRTLNRDYRQKDRPTNVLSFPMVQPDLIEGLTNSDDGEVLLGDIVLARGVCEAEASEKGISVEAHATHLIVHGTFHLLGLDHMTDADADEMERAEREAPASRGIADPYAED